MRENAASIASIPYSDGEHIPPSSNRSSSNARMDRIVLCCARLTGSTTFKDNGAYWGGAIYNTDEDGQGFNRNVDGLPVSITTFPDGTIFENNRADVS